jgi:hypothetical protein
MMNKIEVQCRNLSLGLATKAKACKGAGQEWIPGVTFHALGNVGEYEGMKPPLPSELPLWELESKWTPESSKGNLRGPYSLDWNFHYIIKKFLERRCLKWAPMINLDT